MKKEGSTSEVLNWRNSSFVYLEDSEPGWNQSHYFQWKKDSFHKLNLEENRRFDYGERVWDVRIKNELLDANDYWVYINNSPWALNLWIQWVSRSTQKTLSS